MKDGELLGAAADIRLDSEEGAEIDTSAQTSHAERWTNMTDEEAICYLQRYQDLAKHFGLRNIAMAKKHWIGWGIRELRVKSCHTTLTEEEATCYNQKFDDARAAWRTNPNRNNEAKKHFLKHGIGEGRFRYCAP